MAASAIAVAGFAGLAYAVDVALEFDAAVPNSIADSGFTGVLDGLEQPSAINLNTGNGTLELTSGPGDFTSGSAAQQVNAIGVPVDPSSPYTITAAMNVPADLDAAYEGVGIFLGKGQIDYLKLVIYDTPGTQVGSPFPDNAQVDLEFDAGGAGKTDAWEAAFVLNNPGTPIATIELTMGVDPAAGTVTPSLVAKAANGDVLDTKSPGPLTNVPASLLQDPANIAGILSTNKDYVENPPAVAPAVDPAAAPFTTEFLSFSYSNTVAPPPPPPDTPPPPPPPGGGGGVIPAGAVCLSVPERVPSTGGGDIKLTVGQLRTNQRISAAAVRRANAIQNWLDDGIVSDDICGGGIGTADLASDVVTADAAAQATGTPSPRPVNIAAAGSGGGNVTLSVGQLRTNQRISAAAVRRANALQDRFTALTGGDVAPGSISAAKVQIGKSISDKGAAGTVAASTTDVAPAGAGGGNITLTVGQLRTNQKISAAAVRRTNALLDQIAGGLTGANFADGSIGSNELG